MSKRLDQVRQWLLTHIWHHIFLPLGDPQVYTEPEVEIAGRLRVREDALGVELLSEAQEMNRSQHEAAESIQGRAMTLQGAVVIATTLTLTAGGLLLDRAKIASQGWRIAFAVTVLLTVSAFIASGFQALLTSSKTHPWSYPGINDIFDRAGSTVAWARTTRTASYLKCTGLNMRIVQVKAGHLNAAVFWFRTALCLLFALAVLFLAYTVWGPEDLQSTSPDQPRPSVEK